MLNINLPSASLPPQSKHPQAFLDVEAFQTLEAERKDGSRSGPIQGQRGTLSRQIGQLKSKGEDASGVIAMVVTTSRPSSKHSAARLEQIRSRWSAVAGPFPTCRTTASR
jgi:seryl-tRNA synthetase